MSWYPCCCDDRVYVACTECDSEDAPPYLCATAAGIADTVGVNECCADNFNGILWLPFFSDDGKNHEVLQNFNLGSDITLPAGLTPVCMWGCDILPMYESIVPGFSPTPIPGNQVCNDFGTWPTFVGDPPASWLVVVFQDPSPPNHFLIRFYLRDIHLIDQPTGNALSANAAIWTHDLGAGIPECDIWADDIAFTFLEDTSAGLGCNFTGTTVDIKSRNRPRRDWLCCNQDTDAAVLVTSCYTNNFPHQVQLEFAGFDVCVPDFPGHCPNCCDDCAEFNGTYILTRNAEGPPELNWCTYSVRINPPICEFDLLSGVFRAGGSFDRDESLFTAEFSSTTNSDISGGRTGSGVGNTAYDIQPDCRLVGGIVVAHTGNPVGNLEHCIWGVGPATDPETTGICRGTIMGFTPPRGVDLDNVITMKITSLDDGQFCATT